MTVRPPFKAGDYRGAYVRASKGGLAYRHSLRGRR